MTLTLTKKQLDDMDKLKVGETIDVTYKGSKGYIEKVGSGERFNIRYNYQNYVFKFYGLFKVSIR